MSRECRIGGHIFVGIDGEGAGGWGTNRGKMTVGGGGYRVGTGAITRDGATCGTCKSRGK